MSKNELKWDLEQWDKQAICVEEALVEFAPLDYWTSGDESPRKFFTWEEALRIEAEALLPNGWRLPTNHDWQAVINALHGGIVGPLKLIGSGYVQHRHMAQFSKNPAEFPSLITCDGFEYHYWARDADAYPGQMDKCACAMYIGKGHVPYVVVQARLNNGYAIRAVRDI